MWPRRSIGIALIGLLAIAPMGCVSLRMRIGEPVKTMPLDSLRIGEATRADVVRALGQPLGRGRSMLPIDPGPRTVWAYVYAEASVESNAIKDIRQALLWVYFDGDRYDGYLWFSSFPNP